MSRRCDHIVIRRTNGLEIVCFNFDTIYVKHKYGINLYHRWLIRQRYFYRSKWKPFRDALLYLKNVDMALINRLADKYEIDVDHATEIPDYSGRKVKIAREWGRNRNVH